MIRNMKRMDSGTVGKQLGAILAAGEPVEITRYGKVVAILKPYPARDEPTEIVVKAKELRERTTTQSVTINAPVGNWAQRNPEQARRDAILRGVKTK
jgi:antitoxin (DNA-binding transcriptional repressor) of toxin-antitoxin stability system